MKQRLRLSNYREPDQVFEVEFRRTEHYSTLLHRGKLLLAYEVLVDGTVVGKVLQETRTCERRTRGARYVNARWTGAKPEWKAQAAGSGRSVRGRRETRAEAAGELLGYSRAEVVR